MIKKDLMAVYQLKSEYENLKKRVMGLKKRLVNICDTLNEPLPEYTGWFVLLKKQQYGEGWEFAGFYNPDACDEEEVEPEWTVALAIPKTETVEKFRGW